MILESSQQYGVWGTPPPSLARLHHQGPVLGAVVLRDGAARARMVERRVMVVVVCMVSAGMDDCI
jgi:hypothetical protein